MGIEEIPTIILKAELKYWQGEYKNDVYGDTPICKFYGQTEEVKKVNGYICKICPIDSECRKVLDIDSFEQRVAYMLKITSDELLRRII